jgi:hypothetical protein
MKGCLALIIGLVVVFVVIAAIGSSMHGPYTTFGVNGSSSVVSNSGGHHNSNSSAGTSGGDACISAHTKERAAMAAWKSGKWQSAFDVATSGLHVNDMCSDDSHQLANKGFLLSARATAEHHLGSGDWKTDMNEANATLVSCQTQPGLYATHIGAQCETQENYNIRATTQWELAAAEAQ